MPAKKKSVQKNSKKINKNQIIAISVVAVVLLIIIIWLLTSSPESIDENIDMIQSNLGKVQAEQLALAANQDWVVDLQPDYKVEVVDTTLENGIWTVNLRLWMDKEVCSPLDKNGFILAYKVHDATGEVDRNPQRTLLG